MAGFAVGSPVAVGMLVCRRGHGAFVAAGVAGHICIVVIAMCLRYPALVRIGAIFICAGAVMAGFAIGSPVAVGMLVCRRGHGAVIAAGVADHICIIVIAVCFRYSALVLGGTIFICADAVMAGFAIGDPITVGMLVCRRGHGAVIAADIAGHICIVVIAVCLRLPALVGMGAIFICADAVVTGFAVASPVAVGMLMLCAEAPVAADVAELILIVVIGVGCAVHFFRVWAVFDRADVIVTLGVIFPAVKGVGMAQAGGAHIAAVVAVVVAVIVVDMVCFVLNAPAFVRAVRVCAFMPMAVYVPAPIAVDMAAGMIRGNGTDIAAKVAGGVRVIVIDVGSPVDDPAVLLRAVRVGAFAPMLPAVPAPLAVVVGMGRGDGTVVAADATNVAAVGVARLPGLGLAAGFGTSFPVFGTVIVPFPVGVLGVPVAAVLAVAVAVEGMGRFVLLRAGSVCADRVGTLAPVAGLIPAVEAFGVGVTADGAGIAAGDAGRAGLAAVIVFFVVGNKIAITIVNIALLPVMGPTGAPLGCEIVIMSPIFEAALAVVRNHAVVIRAAKDVFAAGCDRAAAGLSALLPVLVLVAEIGPEVMLAGDGADVAAGLTGGVVFAEAVGVEVLRDRAAVLRAGVPVTALVRGPDLLEAVLVVCHTAAAADAVFVIVMHRGHKDVKLDILGVTFQRPQRTAVNGQVIPDILLVGDKEGAARLGLQVEFGAVGLAADDGPREGLSVNRAPAGISRLRVLAAQQPVGGILRRCDHRGRLRAVGLSFFDDSAAFRGLDGHIEGADPAAVVARGGDDGDVGLFVAAGAVAGLAAVGLAGGLDIDGEVLLPVMAERGMVLGLCVRSVAPAGVFHLAGGGAGRRDGLRLAPVVAQCGGVLGLTVPAALALAGGCSRSGFGTGSGVDYFQIMTQSRNFFPFLNDPTADFAGHALGQAGFGAGGRGFLDDIPAVGGAIMIDGQLDRQIFPDVIDMETFEVIIARFLLNLFVFIVDDLVR